jgi:RimJ/RimL family protein N-acetyltransferase
LIYIFRQEFGPEALESLDAPCVLYDRRISFKKTLSEGVPMVDEHIKPYTLTVCSKQLEALAIKSGTLTRFKRDPELSVQYERLFLTWINNAVSGGMADIILNWREERQMAGLVTLRCARRTNPITAQPEREARIGMLAVHEEFRRKGIATALLHACEFWCHSLEIPTAAIITQSDNAATITLCQKAGFEQTGTDFVYHYWSPGWVYDTRKGWMRPQ